MSQVASFYLLKDGQRQELSNGDCSGAVYMAIWDWCESELDLDVRFSAPQTEDTLDCALLKGELATHLLAAEIAPDWDLPRPADLPASRESHQSPVAAEAGPGGERNAPAGRPGLLWH